jgi:NADPH-dependent curcumin reductase CurA
MSTSQYTCIILNERPGQGPIKPDTFRIEKRSTEELKASMKDTDVFVSVDYVSLDPAMRGWLNDVRSYLEPVKIGAIMRAGGLATVLAVGIEVQNIKIGDTVSGMMGTYHPYQSLEWIIEISLKVGPSMQSCLRKLLRLCSKYRS